MLEELAHTEMYAARGDAVSYAINRDRAHAIYLSQTTSSGGVVDDLRLATSR